jgi:DNA-binding XRE family transcriptional regulator
LQDNFFKDPERLAKFLDRMKELRREKNLKFQKDFNEKIGIQRALTRWKTGESTPSLTSCVAIKKAFGKSLDWIILGEEMRPSLAELRSEYEDRPLPHLAADLLNTAWITLDAILKAEKQRLRPEDKVALLAQIYNDCAKDRIKPDKIMVKHYLWKILDELRR